MYEYICVNAYVCINAYMCLDEYVHYHCAIVINATSVSAMRMYVSVSLDVKKRSSTEMCTHFEPKREHLLIYMNKHKYTCIFIYIYIYIYASVYMYGIVHVLWI